MAIDDLKAYLHELIDMIEDEEKLVQTAAFLNGLIVGTDWWDKLPPEEKEQIEQALDEYEQGGPFFTNEQVQQEAKNWLKDKSTGQ